MEALLPFVLACFALAGSPGPATLSLAAAGAAFGARGALAFMLGIVTGMLAVMGLVVGGLAAALLALPGAAPVAAAAGAVYFLWLAARIAMVPPLAEGSASARPTFAGGVLLSLVNPKAYAAVSALYSGFVLVRGHMELDAAAKIAVMIVVTALVNAAWLKAGAGLTRFFRAPRSSRALNALFALLLVASVAFAAWI